MPFGVAMPTEHLADGYGDNPRHYRGNQCLGLPDDGREARGDDDGESESEQGFHHTTRL